MVNRLLFIVSSVYIFYPLWLYINITVSAYRVKHYILYSEREYIIKKRDYNTEKDRKTLETIYKLDKVCLNSKK